MRLEGTYAKINLIPTEVVLFVPCGGGRGGGTIQIIKRRTKLNNNNNKKKERKKKLFSIHNYQFVYTKRKRSKSENKKIHFFLTRSV